MGIFFILFLFRGRGNAREAANMITDVKYQTILLSKCPVLVFLSYEYVYSSNVSNVILDCYQETYLKFL